MNRIIAAAILAALTVAWANPVAVIVTGAVPHPEASIAEVRRFMTTEGFPQGSKIIIHWVEEGWAGCTCPCDRDPNPVCDGSPQTAVVTMPVWSQAGGEDYNLFLSHELWHAKQCLVGGEDFSIIDEVIEKYKAGTLTEDESRRFNLLLEGWEREAMAYEKILAGRYEFVRE